MSSNVCGRSGWPSPAFFWEAYTGDGPKVHPSYTVRLARAVYVLHAFQKKAKKGIRTPKHEIDLIAQRLKTAEEHYAEWVKEQEDEQEEAP